MSYRQTDRYSFIQGAREVMPNLPLQSLRAKIGFIASRAFPYLTSALVSRHHTIDDELHTQGEVVLDGIGVSAATVNPVDQWSLIEFNRVVIPGRKINKKILKVIENTIDSDEMNSRRRQLAGRLGFTLLDQLSVRLDKLSAADGRLALVIKESPAANYLRQESALLYQLISSTGPGSDLVQGERPGPLEITIGRIPESASARHIEQFLEQSNQQIPADGLRAGLTELNWNWKIKHE